MDLQHSATPVVSLYVGNRERALAFYRDTLGVALRGSDDFGDRVDSTGALLRMTVVPGHEAAPRSALGWNVDDTVFAMESLRDRGVGRPSQGQIRARRRSLAGRAAALQAGGRRFESDHRIRARE